MHGPPDSPNSDQHIVKEALKGNSNGFTEIIRLTSRIVAQITFTMITGSEDRKDVIQDIYLKTWKNLEGFQFKSRLTTWIAQIAYRTCLNYLERKKIKVAIDLDDIHEEKIREEPTPYSKDLKEIIKTEIEELPMMYKTLIILYHQEELSYEEIAQVTGMSMGTVKSYLFRARRLLKEKLLTKYKKEEL